jgi:TRAP-type C4-dicarboxylate transport system permease small subunit
MLLRTLDRVNKTLTLVGMALTSLCVIAMTLILCADVFLRYVFAKPLHATVEVISLLMVSAAVLAMAMAQRDRRHIRVELLLLRLPQRARLGLEVISLILLLGIFGVMTYQTGMLAWHSFLIKEITVGIIAFPIWVAKLIVPIGLLIWLLQAIEHLMEAIGSYQTSLGAK